MGEDPLDLNRRQGRETRPLHGDIRTHLPYLIDGVNADELTLAVEVGGYYHLVGFLRLGLDILDECLVCGHLHDVGVDELPRLHVLPLLVLVREVHLEYMALQADAPHLVPVSFKRVNGVARLVQWLRLAIREDGRDAPGRSVLFRNDKLHAFPSLSIGLHSANTRIILSQIPSSDLPTSAHHAGMRTPHV